ncbi:MAG: hypothetical protein ACYDIA_11260 [Candidatus Humimicrobiaceae bacterium]
MKNSDTEKKFDINGLTVALTFIALALFLYFTPDYFKIILATRIVSIIFAFIGVIGLGIELNRISGDKKKLGFDNLGIGLAFGILWAFLYFYFNLWWVNIISFIIFFFAIYGFLLGIISIIKNLLLAKSSIKIKFFIKIPIFITQLASFALVILQILKLSKVIE